MASKTKAALQQDKVPEKEGPETPPDSPLLDLSDATVKMLIGAAKKRGYITHDQINLLSKEVNSEQIEDVLAMFSEMCESAPLGTPPESIKSDTCGADRRRNPAPINMRLRSHPLSQ